MTYVFYAKCLSLIEMPQLSEWSISHAWIMFSLFARKKVTEIPPKIINKAAIDENTFDLVKLTYILPIRIKNSISSHTIYDFILARTNGKLANFIYDLSHEVRCYYICRIEILGNYKLQLFGMGELMTKYLYACVYVCECVCGRKRMLR